MKCSKCGGRTVKTNEYDSEGLSPVILCQLCGNRTWPDQTAGARPVAKPERKCLKCNQPKSIEARGLCTVCYRHEAKAGTLDKNFPVLGGWGAKKKTPEPEAPPQIMSKKENPMAKSKKPCLKCGETRAIIGRGLCGTCYHQERDAGTLEQSYPKTRRGPQKKTKAEPADKQPATPVRLAEVEPATEQQAAVTGKAKTIDHNDIVAEEHSYGGYLEKKYSSTEYGAPPQSKEKDPFCFVQFAPRDRELYDDLVKSADHNRRDLAAEILCRLDVLAIMQKRS